MEIDTVIFTYKISLLSHRPLKIYDDCTEYEIPETGDRLSFRHRSNQDWITYNGQYLIEQKRTKKIPGY